MRGRFLFAVIILFSAILLSGCTRVIRSPADELKTSDWQGEYESGYTVALSFDGSNAELTVVGDGEILDISGLCAVTDDTLVICDRGSDFNYSFGYELYGDRVELSVFDSEITLNKL